LFGDLKEDALIAESFRRYLDTNDDSWPLLFPMTKAAVRAMDALGEFSAKELPARLEKFAVTGASKRGWTTWLSAASDPRVVALAPMVIDTLNSKPQMAHQVKVFGTWSDATKDYHPLLRLPENDALRKLWSEIDPYSYRDKIKQPKLLILGNNDPYWATDALNYYWDGLAGPKWVHYVPNAGHNLVQKVVTEKAARRLARSPRSVFSFAASSTANRFPNSNGSTTITTGIRGSRSRRRLRRGPRGCGSRRHRRRISARRPGMNSRRRSRAIR
jgi:PhoPQ-activated pathogenicity-related protein